MTSSHIAKITITALRGEPGGEPFSDLVLSGDITTAAISEITVWHDNGIDGLQVTHSRVVSRRRSSLSFF